MAAVRCGVSGYVAVVALPTCLGALRVPTLVAALGHGAPTAAPAVVRRALARLARATSTGEALPTRVREARRQLARWARRQLARGAFGAASSVLRASEHRSGRHDPRAALLARAARALHTAAPNERATLAAAGGVLRDALARPLSAGREATIRDADLHATTDGTWLTAAARAASTFARGDATDAVTRPAALRALVLLIE